MQNIDYDNLRFRRGYLLTSLQVECPFNHNTEAINKDFTLYYHPDLVFTKVFDKLKSLYLLGDLYDYQDQKATNVAILNKLIFKDFDALVAGTSIYAGRFVLIYSGKEGIRLFHDAASLRKIFYVEKSGNQSCASNPHLLAKAFGFERTGNTCWLDFYESDEFIQLFNGNIGYYTLYDEVRQVLPNHYFDLINNKTVRYWPKEIVEKIDDKEIVRTCAQMIKGFVSAAAFRYPLMIPVTSGYDSRIIYAATRDLTKNIFYYINYSEELKGKPDYLIPKKMLEDNGRTFNIVIPNNQIEERFKEKYYYNNPIPHDFFLPVIYNYFLNFSDKINLPGGFIPVIKSLFDADIKEISGRKLARLYKVERFPCAVDFYTNWLNSTQEICNNLNVDIFDLLYWEDRTCNWGTQVSQDKDIAQDELLIFNSRLLMATMLNYTRSRRKKPRYELHKEIVRELWPELLKIPYNPSLKSTIRKYMVNLGLYKPISNIMKHFR